MKRPINDPKRQDFIAAVDAVKGNGESSFSNHFLLDLYLNSAVIHPSKVAMKKTLFFTAWPCRA